MTPVTPTDANLQLSSRAELPQLGPLGPHIVVLRSLHAITLRTMVKTFALQDIKIPLAVPPD